MKTKIYLFTFMVMSVIAILLSCEYDVFKLDSTNLDEFQLLKKDVALSDNSGNIYSFNLDYKNNVITCNRALAGSYIESFYGDKTSNIPHRYELLIKDPTELKNFIINEKVWFIPNSFAPPIRLKLSEEQKHRISPRTVGGLSEKCFCEVAGPSPYLPSECSYLNGGCLILNCDECDIEFCIDTGTDTVSIPGTRGGGIFLLADTVICVNGVTNIVFGGKTKVELNISQDTLYFKRTDIYSTNIFEQCYFNTSHTTITSLGTNLWVIPFDKNILARSLVGKDCKAVGTCSGCDYDQQSNGCFRCKCTGIGDCDYSDAAFNIVPNGVLVSSPVIVEMP